MIVFVRLIYLAIIIHDIPASKGPEEVGVEISPGGCGHMDMYEVSLVLMEVDTILWLHSDGHITSRHLLHVDIFREVPLFSIYHYEHVGMMMDLVWFRFEEVGECRRDGNENERKENFFHKMVYYSTAWIITSRQAMTIQTVTISRGS